jgi:adenosylcobinamide-GDP ribazoletransferase
MNYFCRRLHSQISFGNQCWQTWLGAIAFYTCIPIPHHWPLNFSGIARWAPIVGLLMGAGLAGVNLFLSWCGMPVLVRSTLLVAVWVAITGGLHLDGAMDTADGLAVLDPQRRLEVMADSRAGAFAVMAASLILLLKSAALSSLTVDRGWALMVAAGWGRWGQLHAIVRYPYLKPTGKGAFHKEAIRSQWDVVPTCLILVGVSSIPVFLRQQNWQLSLFTSLACGLIAAGSGAWFNHKFGGHTGDTYGATVEWTETFILCGLTTLQ